MGVESVRLGGTGLEVSRLCLGAWKFGPPASGTGPETVDERTAHAILDAADETGINFVDTANAYGLGRSEEYIGTWLAGRDREDVVVASKVFFALSGRQRIGLSRKIVRAEIEGTLRRLGTDYLDVYYIHGWHPGSPLVETLRALSDLVAEGRVHYIGVSNFAAWQVVLAHQLCESRGWAPISVVQPRFNAVDNVPFTLDPEERALPDLFDACRYLDLAVCPFSPLAEGFLTGKYTRGPDGAAVGPPGSRGDLADGWGPKPERWWDVLDAVRAVADELGTTPARVAIAWASQVPGLTSVPIVGVTSVAQLEQAAGGVGLGLSPAQHRRIADAGASPDLSPGAYTYT